MTEQPRVDRRHRKRLLGCVVGAEGARWRPEHRRLRVCCTRRGRPRFLRRRLSRDSFRSLRPSELLPAWRRPWCSSPRCQRPRWAPAGIRTDVRLRHHHGNAPGVDVRAADQQRADLTARCSRASPMASASSRSQRRSLGRSVRELRAVARAFHGLRRLRGFVGPARPARPQEDQLTKWTILPASTGFIRFCSAFMAGPAEGFANYTLLLNEESNDIITSRRERPTGRIRRWRHTARPATAWRWTPRTADSTRYRSTAAITTRTRSWSRAAGMTPSRCPVTTPSRRPARSST